MEHQFSQRSSSRVERASGRHMATLTTVVTGSNQVSLTVLPTNMGARATALSDLYRFYRFVGLKIHFFQSAEGSPPVIFNAALVAFTRGSVTVPQTAAEVIQIENACVNFPHAVNPSCLTLTKKHLLGKAQVKWFQTQGAGDAELDTQGILFFVSVDPITVLAEANTMFCVFEWDIEFQDRLPAGVSMDRMRRRDPMAGYVAVHQDEKDSSVDGDPVVFVQPVDRRLKKPIANTPVSRATKEGIVPSKSDIVRQ